MLDNLFHIKISLFELTIKTSLLYIKSSLFELIDVGVVGVCGIGMIMRSLTNPWMHRNDYEAIEKFMYAYKCIRPMLPTHLHNLQTYSIASLIQFTMSIQWQGICSFATHPPCSFYKSDIRWLSNFLKIYFSWLTPKYLIHKSTPNCLHS